MFFDDIFNPEKAKAMDLLPALGFPMGNPTSWWMRYPVRAVEEAIKLRDNCNGFYEFVGSNMVYGENIISNYGTRYDVLIIIPESFPFVMPEVNIREPKIDLDDTKHYWGNGVPCIMHPNEYHSNISVLEMRNMTSVWIFAYEGYLHTGEWNAREHEH